MTREEVSMGYWKNRALELLAGRREPEEEEDRVQIVERGQEASVNGVVAQGAPVRTDVTTVTPDVARGWVEYFNYARQRPIRQGHVDYLASAITMGELVTLEVRFAEWPNGNRVIVDGQHRLRALMAAGRSLPCVAIYYRVESDEDVARLYASIDRQTTRSTMDAVRAYGIEERTGATRDVLRRVAYAAPILSARFSREYGKHKSLIRRAEAVEEWVEEGKAFYAATRGGTSEVESLLRRAPVLAVALATFRHAPELAETFWGGLAREDGLRRGDPRHKLLSWMRNMPIVRVGSSILYCMYVAAAWNAFYEGRTLEK